MLNETRQARRVYVGNLPGSIPPRPEGPAPALSAAGMPRAKPAAVLPTGGGAADADGDAGAERRAAREKREASMRALKEETARLMAQ